MILDLLESGILRGRGHGWAALTSAFPDLAVKAGDYRLDDSVAECRRKTEGLRRAAAEFAKPREPFQPSAGGVGNSFRPDA